jgi:hypothetical protein
MSDIRFAKSQAEFWRLHSQTTLPNHHSRFVQHFHPYGERFAPKSHPDLDPPPAAELASFVDEYNPHGAFHYGGSFPLTPLQQVHHLLISSSLPHMTSRLRLLLSEPRQCGGGITTQSLSVLIVL